MMRQPLRQCPQPARVLGGDEIGLLQAAPQALGGVGGVADRGGGQGDGPAAQVGAVRAKRSIGGIRGDVGPAVPVGSVGPAVRVVPDVAGGEVSCGRDALSHRTQYVVDASMTPPPRLGV